MYKLFNGDCDSVMKSDEFHSIVQDKHVVVVTDPPFNIGYHYNTYKDKMNDGEYFQFMGGGIRGL